MSLRTPTEPSDNFKLPTKPSTPQDPKPDAWRKTDSKGIEVNQDGKLRTNIPIPKPTFFADPDGDRAREAA